MDGLLLGLKEAEELLQFPGVAGHVDRATKLLTFIARSVPDGSIANLCMQAISEAGALHPSPLPLNADYTKLNRILWRLRIALQQAISEAKQVAEARAGLDSNQGPRDYELQFFF